MTGNSILNKSRYTKNNDEFYTTIETIEKELSYYTKELSKKTILCNCDNPFESNFSKYFIRNFNQIGIKRLICTSYSSSKLLSTDNNLVNENGEWLANPYGYVLDITKVPNDISPTSSDVDISIFLKKEGNVKKLKGNGDFRSLECIEYLKMADVVITNPPFSLFRELLTIILEYNKKFLLIGNANAISYKEIFPLIQKNKVWLGYHFGDMEFRVPADAEPRKTRYWVDNTGQKWRSLGNAMWLTNIDIERRHKMLDLNKYYDAMSYSKYDEFDAIEVTRVADIPVDYDGVMAVPITFLNKHNPKQFKIIGEANHGSDNPFDLFKPTINGKLIFKRILIQRI